MTSKNSVLAKFKYKVIFDEYYSEKDFENDCKLFEVMTLDLAPDNQVLFASFYLNTLKKGKPNTVELIKYKSGLLTNDVNRDWFKSMPKNSLRKLLKKLKSMRTKV